jgi:LmbE family N-acetylglucosaminyl deacetylase
MKLGCHGFYSTIAPIDSRVVTVSGQICKPSYTREERWATVTANRNIRLLGIFAHPDDEVFCIGGTLAKYAAAGAETMVVSFTRGEAGQIRDASIATRRTLGAKRKQELHHSCNQLGVQHVRCLDYGDGTLKDIPQEQLVRHATAIIREFQPDIVFTFDDTGAYGHPDHIVISRVTTIACRQSGDPEAFPDQIALDLLPHSPARLYHSYFPRNDRLLLQLLVKWLTRLDTKFRGSADFIHGLLLFADESTMLGYAADHIKVAWYPSGFYIIEQGEPATSLYLILSGDANIIIEDSTGSQHVDTRGPGVFIGELGLAFGKPRNAHVIAATNVTCLVFSPGEPTQFAGRGEQAQFATADKLDTKPAAGQATTRIDVRDFVPKKIAAMAEHRSQYPVTPDMFPIELVEEMLGYEYFVQIQPPIQMQTELL